MKLLGIRVVCSLLSFGHPVFNEQQRLMLILEYFTGDKHGTAPSDVSFSTWSCENVPCAKL